MLNQTEMYKLIDGCLEKGINFTVYPFLGGLILVACDEHGDRDWDAICHRGSYGHAEGLLEISGSCVGADIDDDVEGFLTAEDILARL